MAMIPVDRDSFRVLYQVLKNGPLLRTSIINRIKINQLVSLRYLTYIAVLNDNELLAATPVGSDAFRRFVGESDVVDALRRFELTEPNATE